MAESLFVMGREFGYDMTTQEGLDAFARVYNASLDATNRMAPPPMPFFAMDSLPGDFLPPSGPSRVDRREKRKQERKNRRRIGGSVASPPQSNDLTRPVPATYDSVSNRSTPCRTGRTQTVRGGPANRRRFTPVHRQQYRSPRSLSRRLAVNRHVAAYRGMVGLMIVSLWHAPIPWVHAHDLSGPVVEHSVTLHHHIDEFHAREVELGEEHLSLHSHLMLPWEGSNHDEFPGEHSRGHSPDDVLFSLKFAGGVGQSVSKQIGPPSDRAFDAAGVQALPALQQFPARGAAPLAPFRLGGHFFDTFGRSVSMADLIGVRLC